MSLQPILLAVYLFAACVCSPVYAEPLLLMPEPLDGYIVSKAPIGSVEKPQGYLISVEKDGVVDKVQILIELRDLQDPDARIAATKAYVNSFTQAIVESGLTVSAKQIPEITAKTVAKKILADVSFTQPDGSAILTRHAIFFTNYGYDVRIIATSKESLESLTAWANLIRPLPNNN